MKFSPEQNFSRGHERDRSLVEVAYKKAEALIEQHRINPLDFIENLYGEANVQADLAYVERRKQGFKETETSSSIENKRLAQVLEAVIFQRVKQSDWFGQNTTMILASEYDDIKNKVDGILEIEEQNAERRHIVLGIDATYDSDPTKKLGKIADRIEHPEKEGEELAMVKYFKTHGFRGELKNIPRIVLGVEARVVEGIADLDLNDKDDLIAKHPVQFQLIDEAIIQCEGFAAFARKIGKIEVALKYERRLAFFQAVMKKKKAVMFDSGERDRVCRGIKDFFQYLQ